ncbi:MAG: hypothetical protein WCK02_07665 [Bacteroidota bacterium]
MNRFLLLFFLVALFSFQVFSAEMKLKGGFYGDNIIIDNPSIDNNFCVKSVKVNGIISNSEISSNTFEIDLIALNLEIGATIDIIITHSDNCKPKILNPEVLIEKCGFTMVGNKQDKKTDEISFTMVKQLSKLPYTIEQYRWKRWIEVQKIDVVFADTAVYKFKPVLHSGANLFRVKQTSNRGNTCYSADIKARSMLKEVTFLYDKKALTLTFSIETKYEIYDKKGVLVKSGFAKTIELSDISRDAYFLNYDNESIQVYL